MRNKQTSEFHLIHNLKNCRTYKKTQSIMLESHSNLNKTYVYIHNDFKIHDRHFIWCKLWWPNKLPQKQDKKFSKFINYELPH